MAFCPQCGTKLRGGARFCESCGSAVQAPAAPEPMAVPVGAVAAGSASVQTPAWSAPHYASGPVPDAGTAPLAGGPADGPPPAPRRSRRGLVAGLGGLAAAGVLGVVGYVVYDQLTGPNGGAASPAAAVLELSAAADAEDAVTALSLLPPGEVGPLVTLYEDVEAKATSTGVAAQDDPFAGFDLRLQGVTVQPDQLGEDVAAVTITRGTVSWTLDPDQLQGALRVDSDGDVRRATDGSADLVEITRNASEGAPLRIMTVQRDGQWYVSPMYTLLELWRASRGLPAPDFSQALDYEGTGAESATAAVEQATQALSAYDVNGFLDLLSPDEAAAFYQYREAIITALNRDGALAELQSEGQLMVDGIDAVEGDEVDGRVPVTVRGATGTLTGGGDAYSWSLQGNCLSWTGDGASDGGCLDQVFTEMGLGADLASEFRSATILTQEVDGRWYLSPLATLVADARNVVAGLDGDEVAGMLGVPQFGSVDGRLTEGTTTEAELQGPDGVALFEMDVPAGKVFSVCSDNSAGWRIYGPDGRPAGADAVLAGDGGRYRVLAYGDGESGSVSVTPSLSDVQTASFPSTIPAGGDGACGARLVTVELTAGEPVIIGTEGDSATQVISPSGESSSGSAFVPAETGAHTLVVPAAEDVSLDTLPDDTLRAGSSVPAGVTAGSSTTFTVFVEPRQSIDITVYGDGSMAPGVELYTLDGSYVDGASADWFSSTATVYPSYQDVGQVYQLVISSSSGQSGAVRVDVTAY